MFLSTKLDAEQQEVMGESEAGVARDHRLLTVSSDNIFPPASKW
jgi:hypothetical protein